MTTSITPFIASGYGDPNLYKDPGTLKHQYAEQLSLNGDTCLDNGSFKSELLQLPLEKLQLLYLNLRNVFTSACLNSERQRIVNCLRGISQDQWPVVLKQSCFIMPIGSRGHDVMWSIEILTSIDNLNYRNKLVHVANRFFDYDTLTVERGYILEALSKLSLEALIRIDNAQEEERSLFIKDHVPESLKKMNRIACIYDPILEKGWNVP